MKAAFIFLALILTVSKNSVSQNDNNTTNIIFQTYLKIKDALVNSNSSGAATAAKEMVTLLEKGENELIGSNDNKVRLLKDADQIAKTSSLGQQRKYFSSLSTTLIGIASKIKLSPVPIYEQYCPMKNASWLSLDKNIKNPYYGQAMLTCGSVKSTF